MVMKVCGIPNCMTVKKARAWLDARDIPCDFVDFRKSPPTPADLARWCAAFGWETVLNRRGTTWRMLDAATQAAVRDQGSAIDLMRERPAAIRRPIVEAGAVLLVGFDEAVWRRKLR